MSETPTPSKEQASPNTGQTKRRGLALPPRGQALARLQDLEQDLEEEGEQSTLPAERTGMEALVTEGSNAVNTARSNAVNHQGSTDKPNEQIPARATRNWPTAPKTPVRAPASQEPAPAAPAAAYQMQARAAREPTTRITVDMPDSLHRKISMLAAETRRSIKDLVLDALATTYFAADQDRS